ncbi:DUF1754-domain-containing protein [Pseudovirgaria hyperparasitica]|uniref:DUF1754-domain-containing protein n=1 Tax=Pseudovirgaria hyperparasitica TaxID=470096 RepID=A0A6A6W8Y4_9PEZI|nr:DUF1754-domain-containing protein [Pseudovirgaria hyperparasitica]KAF2759015.1 DUF1754-domain-containing protein [Pseudovirgaria hyperparasitica]
MAPAEYTSVGAGSLKLKGAAGVEKKKKKKKTRPGGEAAETSSKRDVPPQVNENHSSSLNNDQTENATTSNDDTMGDNIDKQLADFKARGGKTEAELRFEEQRKRRLNERLKREGVKTHKEKVEDLNRYLSTLSEHHDMPRIGPG